MGLVKEIPMPVSGKKISNIRKLGAIEQNTAETKRNPIPITKIDFGLYLTLNPPTIIAEKNAKIDDIVLICPVTPMGLLNVCPISINNKPTSTLGIPEIILLKVRVGKTILPTDIFSSLLL